MSKTGYIYKLCCNDTTITDCYVGSTKNEKVRKNGHKVRCNGNGDKSHYYVYQFIRDNGGWGNWNMIRLEEFKFDNRAELHTRERYWLETLGATLNKMIPTRTSEEWYVDNREEVLERVKKYREANPEIIKQHKKKYADENKDKIAEKQKEYKHKNREILNKKRIDYYYANKEEVLEKAKVYAQKNKEVIAQKGKIHRQKNKEVLSEKAKIKMTCECGSVFRKGEKSRHEKTQKHNNFISVPHILS
jgi:hypothetical protein